MEEDATKERILIAAKEVFSNKGYTRATTKEISKLSGLAEVTLFRHFETKGNLFYETIYKYLIVTMLDSTVLDGSLDARQSILNLIQERIDTLRKNKDLFICTIYEAQFNDEIKDMLKRIHSKVFDALVLYLEFNQEKIKDMKIEYTAQLFLSTMVGQIVFETLSPSEELVDSEDLIKTIRTFIFE